VAVLLAMSEGAAAAEEGEEKVEEDPRHVQL
jgi:hypothetical protein